MSFCSINRFDQSPHNKWLLAISNSNGQRVNSGQSFELVKRLARVETGGKESGSLAKAGCGARRFDQLRNFDHLKPLTRLGQSKCFIIASYLAGMRDMTSAFNLTSIKRPSRISQFMRNGSRRAGLCGSCVAPLRQRVSV